MRYRSEKVIRRRSKITAEYGDWGSKNRVRVYENEGTEM